VHQISYIDHWRAPQTKTTSPNGDHTDHSDHTSDFVNIEL
jgi:hypothetical protein